MFQPEDPFAPPGGGFDEPWQAQALAMADLMVTAGHFSASEWSETLGACLREAEAEGLPDTLETYYVAVVAALERLSESRTGISADERVTRRAEWEAAYHRTPHGKPVLLHPDTED